MLKILNLSAICIASVLCCAAENAPVYHTSVPIEPDARIDPDGYKDVAGSIDYLVRIIRLNGYKCDSIRRFYAMILYDGTVIGCDQGQHNYEIKEVGGHLVVTVK